MAATPEEGRNSNHARAAGGNREADLTGAAGVAAPTLTEPREVVATAASNASFLRRQPASPDTLWSH